MTLLPLLHAPLPIQIHAFAALALIPLTLVMFTLPRGTSLHRVLGWSWVLLMTCVALTSFWIHEIRLIGGFSPIHLLSIGTLVALLAAVFAARHQRIRQHRQVMIWTTSAALMGAGVFTLLPGRLMHAVLFSL
ncbi:DUF2306 domain-containing protein [Pseudophaeobacter sp.]|uniref:DUF2306 domain-containing protein n=1 Tax=Pseudophaeobacter sp. TaxID=1971739 RepID=UPI0032984998